MDDNLAEIPSSLHLFQAEKPCSFYVATPGRRGVWHKGANFTD